MEAERGRLHAMPAASRRVEDRGLETGRRPPQIVPAILGDENAALVARRKLESAGILAVAIGRDRAPGPEPPTLSLAGACGDAEMSRLIDAWRCSTAAMIVMHGWGYDRTVWRRMLPVLDNAVITPILDSVGRQILPDLSKGCLGVGHSLGFLWLLKNASASAHS